MDKNAVLEIIQRFRDALQANGINVDKIVLFGSYANGDYKEASDIDIVVVSDSFRDMDFWERIEVISEAIYEVRAPIEAIPATKKEWEEGDRLLLQFAKNGIVI